LHSANTENPLRSIKSTTGAADGISNPDAGEQNEGRGEGRIAECDKKGIASAKSLGDAKREAETKRGNERAMAGGGTFFT